MFYLPAFTFSSGYSLGFGFLAGLRLLVLRQFQTFFASIAPPPWRTAFSRFALVVNLGLPVLASGSNRAVKPTRLRRAAYFRSLVPSYSRFMQAAIYSSVLSIAKVQPLALGRCAGLRLQSLRSFQAFLASSSRPACASSSFFGSVLRVRGAFSNPVGSNPAVKRTRILRAAYLGLQGLPSNSKQYLSLGLSRSDRPRHSAQ